MDFDKNWVGGRSWPKNFPKLQMRSAGARVARTNVSKKGSGAEQAKALLY